jgi:nucleotide-binding universal stress UspA family protein
MGQRILVPVDSSKRAREGLDYALEQFPDAAVTVLHVRSTGSGDIAAVGPGPSPFDTGGDDSGTDDTGEPRPEGDLASAGPADASAASTESADPGDAGRKLLDRVADYAADRGVEVETELMRGRPDRAIVKRAEDGEFDLVVLGSHGRDGVARVLLGSVAEKVVRRSPVPVLVVR